MNFHEVKKLETPGLYIHLGIFVFIIVIVSISDKKFSWADALMIAVAIAFSLIFAWYMRLFELHLLIDHTGIRLKYPPFVKIERHIPWNDIESSSLVKMQLWGWGYQKNNRLGEIFTTGGNIGLYIRKRDGKKILLSIRDHKKIRKDLSQIAPADKFRNVELEVLK